MSNEKKSNSSEPQEVFSTGPRSGPALREVGHEDTTSAIPIVTEASQSVKAIKEQADATGSLSSSADGETRRDEAALPIAAKEELAGSPGARPEDANASVPMAIEKPEATEAAKQQVDASESPLPSVGLAARTGEVVPPNAVRPIFMKKSHRFFEEQPLPLVEMAPRTVHYRTRREVLAFGIAAAAVATGSGYLLPKDTLSRLGVRRDISSRGKEWLLDNAFRIDDDVAEALYSRNRMVPTYTKSQITPIKNNYNGATPDPWYVSGWKITLEGLASGLNVALDIRGLANRFHEHEQITRFVCVEGWSAIAWWAGLRFDDLLRAYPPISQAKWARVESSVNLDSSGNPDPYFVSIDLATARHPQTLLVTHHNGQPLTVEHGAPLRLLVPVKLGLKNVKAVTRITYSAEEPGDYWAPYGYSSYDGI